MSEKPDVWQGTLSVMVLKTLETMGPLHGYGIAFPPNRADEWRFVVCQLWNLYVSLLKLEQEGYIASEWGLSDNNRKAKYYKLTRSGSRKQLEKEARE